jgi:hypothetical protein
VRRTDAEDDQRRVDHRPDGNRDKEGNCEYSQSAANEEGAEACDQSVSSEEVQGLQQGEQEDELEEEEEEEEEQDEKEEEEEEEEEQEEDEEPVPKRARKETQRSKQKRKSRTSRPKSTEVSFPPSSLMDDCVPCIKLDSPIPLDVLLRGLATCARYAQKQSVFFQEALHDALYIIRLEIEDRISDGKKMEVTYYKQAKRNNERNASAVSADQMERARAMQVLDSLLQKWKEIAPTSGTRLSRRR